MAGLLNISPGLQNFGGDALTGIGGYLAALGAGGQYRNQAGLLGIQALQQSQAQRQEQQYRALQNQSLTQQMALQQQAASRQAAQDKAQQDRLAQLQTLTSNLPPDQQALAQADPESFFKAQITQKFAQPKTPSLEHIRQGTNDVTGYFDPANPTKFVQLGSGPAFAPQQPQQAPSDVQEYQFAQNDKLNPFKGSFTDFLSTKRGATQMVPIGTDANGQPIFSFQPVATSKPPTEDQAKNGQLYTRTSEQLPIVLDNFDALSNPKNQFLSKLPLSAATTSPEYQRASNALTDIASSYLYSVSGATANAGEVANLVSTITPKIGESEQSKADKKQRIKDMVDSIKQRTQQGQTQGVGGVPKQDPLGIR